MKHRFFVDDPTPEDKVGESLLVLLGMLVGILAGYIILVLMTRVSELMFLA